MWSAAEPRAEPILAHLERESKQFRDDRILHLPHMMKNDCRADWCEESAG
jgi:hypothetical protein